MAYQVLVVEDDNFLRKAYTAKLTNVGFDVKIASDGVEALEMLATYTPDIILLDLIMPRKDGFATLEEINQNPNLKDVPIIVASNLGQTDEINRLKSLGVDNFFTKSDMSMQELVQKINTIIAASKA